MGRASAVESTAKRHMRLLTKHIAQLDNDVHQALAVMDADTRKILNYMQLLRNPKYKKNWTTSSVNEFGCLENGVGGRIKNPTNKITFIQKKDIPNNRKEAVTYRQFICRVRGQKKEKTVPDSQ